MNKPMTKQEWFEYLDKTWDAAQKEARAEQQKQELDSDCKEADGCPTEKAVLQRFWREAQKQEPEAWWDKETGDYSRVQRVGWSPLYPAPPKREWQGLTDEEMYECWDSPLTPLGMKHARMIEAKLKQKNHD